MPRPKLEVADIFRAHGATYRRDHSGHLNLPQLKVMSAVETCRTAALGGHVSACTQCSHQHIAYNSCRNRHCPKCQGGTARDWMQARMEDLLPVEYFHVVFTLPSQIADIAYQNKAAVYGLLFKASAQTLLTIAADTKYLGAKIGMTSVMHTWGSAMTHHPHVHVIVPGGGMSKDGTRWVACRPGFFLPVKVLSRLFRRLFIEGLIKLHKAVKLRFFGELTGLADIDSFAAHLVPLRKTNWVVYAKPPQDGVINMAQGNKPVFNARAKQEPDSEYKQTIGAAWTFKEGEGYVVRLHSIPTQWDGSFILVPPKDPE